MNSAEKPVTRPARRQIGFQEGGLVLVVLLADALSSAIRKLLA